MTSASTCLRSAVLEQRSTRIVFFIAGFGMAAWAPLVPFAKAHTGINEGMLGVLLLCLGIGSIVAMPVAAALLPQVGCRRVIAVAAIFVCLALPLLATSSSLPVLVVALLIFGASLGAVDVAMNVQAIAVEQASGRAMMSGFHGLFSLGGIVGAAGVTALLSGGVLPLMATLVVVGGILLALSIAAPHLLTHGSPVDGPIFAVPHGVVLIIGCLCFVLFLTEGAVLDWSAVFLTSARGVRAAYAGFGYAVFALTMTIGRLSGDRIVQRYGSNKIIYVGGLCAAAGFAVVTVVPAWQAALVGYALVGVGCSNIVPVLFTCVGRQTLMPQNVAVPAITGVGYAGMLVGPAAIGFVAQLASLSAAFVIVALMLIGVAVAGRQLRL